MPLRTVNSVIAGIKHTSTVRELPAPAYVPRFSDGTGPAVDPRPRIVLGVSSMRDYTTPEGHALQEGLRHAGWQVFGHGFEAPFNLADVREILSRVDPSVVFIQDVREWNGGNFRDPLAKFTNLDALRERPNIFKVGLIRDAHNSVELCRWSWEQAGVHAWIHQYHPRVVKHLNQSVRPQHLIRSWHSVEPADVPSFDKHKREGCLLSGNLSAYYPLRCRLFVNLDKLPMVKMHGHPGYRRDGCKTLELLEEMSKCKVAIVTSSVFGYSVRKLVEATAAGCRIVTDLPIDEMPPEIDHNLTKINSDISINEVRDLLTEMCRTYNPEWQTHLAEKVKTMYDWRIVGIRLDQEVSDLRLRYNVVKEN